MIRAWFLIPLLLAACGDSPTARHADSDGLRLEAAARAAGIVVDPSSVSLVGAWARDGDHVCIVLGQGATYRIGVRVDYGDGQNCAASGTVARSGNAVRLAFGACSFAARFDGDRLTFPPTVPDRCDRLCTGRASLAATTVDRLSTSASEAATLRAADGRLLCSS